MAPTVSGRSVFVIGQSGYGGAALWVEGPTSMCGKRSRSWPSILDMVDGRVFGVRTLA